MAVDASSVSKVVGAPAAFSELTGTVSSAQMPDPYVPVDGTMNVTGSIQASANLTLAQNAQIIPAGLSSAIQLGQSNAPLRLAGNSANGASAVGVRIETIQDYTTAGAKILSVGVNAGSSYAEGACLFAVPSSNPVAQAGVQFNVPHIGGGSTALSLNTCRIGLGAGTTSSGTAVTASGHDLAGRIGVTVNSTGTVNQPILLVSFATAYASPPFVHLTPGNAASATIPLASAPFAVATTSGFSLQGNATGIPTGTYVFQYQCIQ